MKPVATGVRIASAPALAVLAPVAVGCAARADPQINALFREHAVWLAPGGESLPDLLAWNREYPDQPMSIARRNREWQLPGSWAIPTFYVFRDDHLVDQWEGWPHAAGLATLRAHLHKLAPPR